MGRVERVSPWGWLRGGYSRASGPRHATFSGSWVHGGRAAALPAALSQPARKMCHFSRPTGEMRNLEKRLVLLPCRALNPEFVSCKVRLLDLIYNGSLV